MMASPKAYKCLVMEELCSYGKSLKKSNLRLLTREHPHEIRNNFQFINIFNSFVLNYSNMADGVVWYNGCPPSLLAEASIYAQYLIFLGCSVKHVHFIGLCDVAGGIGTSFQWE